jgi:uncharacterized protein
MQPKAKSWIGTYTGRKFYPYDPKLEDVSIEDIAHSLSLQCRFNGHCERMYSVAQHSINCAKLLKELGYGVKHQLYVLLHDASEAYLSDVVKPVKDYLLEYCEVEEDVQNVIWEYFNLPKPTKEDWNIIHFADMQLLYWEGINLTKNIDNWVERYNSLLVDFNPPEDWFKEKLPSEVKSEFISLLEQLLKEANK